LVPHGFCFIRYQFIPSLRERLLTGMTDLGLLLPHTSWAPHDSCAGAPHGRRQSWLGLALCTSLFRPTFGSEAFDNSRHCGVPNLLQVQMARSADLFGPSGCVSLTRSEQSTCVLTTKCGEADLSNVDFAFVCFNPASETPHSLHSYGHGGFEPSETFDTGVSCNSCNTIGTAFTTGGPSILTALSTLSIAAPPSAMALANVGGILAAPDVTDFEPKEAARFGPGACASAFLSPAGTCVVRLACEGVDLSNFNFGVTCLDSSGGFTRYFFGRGTFAKGETFDTRVRCSSCLGVGDEGSTLALRGVLPKQLVDDVNVLKDEVHKLRSVVGGGTDVKGTINEKAKEVVKEGLFAGHEDTPMLYSRSLADGLKGDGSAMMVHMQPNTLTLPTPVVPTPESLTTDGTSLAQRVADAPVVMHQRHGKAHATTTLRDLLKRVAG